MKDYLVNYANYNQYGDFIRHRGDVTVNVTNINKDTWGSHFQGILNIMRDGIETDFVQKKFINIKFTTGEVVKLTIPDYFINLIMWSLIVNANDIINPSHIFLEEGVTRKSIKSYIDTFFVKKYIDVLDAKLMNNIIDDMLDVFRYINEFAFFLADTVNLEDDIILMKNNKEYYDLLHTDFSIYQIEDVKTKSMENTNRIIEIVKNAKDTLGYDHCLANSFRSGEAINVKQFKEVNVCIGAKPNGTGGVFPRIINKSFINGGVSEELDYFMESSIGRFAQILSKKNVGGSGHFARLLGLNNMNIFLNSDPDYVCNTKNLQRLVITSDEMLKINKGSYYRLNPKGIEYLLDEDDVHLIGKTIYLRSPMTCASFSKGLGVCHKCYGKLAKVTSILNIGKIAAEIMSAQLTQMLLSAKHLLEAVAKKIRWNKDFYDFFEIEFNFVKLIQDTELKSLKGLYMVINPEDIEMEDEEDFKKADYSDEDYAMEDDTEFYNEYITSFDIVNNKGETVASISSENKDKLFFSKDLTTVIKNHTKNINDKIYIPLDKLVDIEIFIIIIMNTELSETLNRVISIINKKDVTKSMDRHTLLQNLLETIIACDLHISSKHCEIILANQLRDLCSTLAIPEWQYADAEYEVLTLNEALTNNPSITTSLSYQNLSKVLTSPLSFKKTAPSVMDMFFMEKPQEFLTGPATIVKAKPNEEEEKQLVQAVIILPEEADID